MKYVVLNIGTITAKSLQSKVFGDPCTIVALHFNVNNGVVGPIRVDWYKEDVCTFEAFLNTLDRIIDGETTLIGWDLPFENHFFNFKAVEFGARVRLNACGGVNLKPAFSESAKLSEACDRLGLVGRDLRVIMHENALSADELQSYFRANFENVLSILMIYFRLGVYVFYEKEILLDSAIERVREFCRGNVLLGDWVKAVKLIKWM
jgi:hypothetical protein